jgi:hypothetical protein
MIKAGEIKKGVINEIILIVRQLRRGIELWTNFIRGIPHKNGLIYLMK